MFDSPSLSELRLGATLNNCVTLVPYTATDRAPRVIQSGLGDVDALVREHNVEWN